MAEPLVLLAVAATALFVASLSALVVRPTTRLAGRVRPYAVVSRTALGRSADVLGVARPGALVDGGTLRRLLAPLAVALIRRLSRWVRFVDDDTLNRRLRHAGLLPDVPEPLRAQEFRIRQLGATVAGVVVGAAAGLAVGVAAGPVLLLAVLGGVIGGSRWRARLDRAVEERREQLRIELYTVNQLLAMNIRVGGGIVQAVRRVAERGHGALVDELREVLRAHESGLPLRDAFARASALTAEPVVARTYRLLAAGAEHGADLAEALLAHSDDVRDARREAIRRAATRRRAAMLVPIIGILAPVMLLFIAAPLPSLVFTVP